MAVQRHAGFCEFANAHPDEHGDYCQLLVGDGVRVPVDDGSGNEIEACVSVASRLSGAGEPGVPVVQLNLFRSDGESVVLDLPSRDVWQLALCPLAGTASGGPQLALEMAKAELIASRFRR